MIGTGFLPLRWYHSLHSTHNITETGTEVSEFLEAISRNPQHKPVGETSAGPISEPYIVDTVSS